MPRKKKELEKKSGTYQILRNLSYGKKRFSAFLKDVPRRTLSDRLKELTDEGYIKRVIEPTYPVSTWYFIEEKGKELFEELITKEASLVLNELFLFYPQRREEFLSSYLKK